MGCIRMRGTFLIRISLTLAFLSFCGLQIAEEYSQGKHYEVLSSPLTTRDPSKIEVVEVFWYGCNHCHALESYINKWEKQLAKDVYFKKSPATWNPTLMIHARLFYTAKALGIEEKVTPAAFTAIHRERRFLTGNSELEYFFRGFGINKERYNSVSTSFGVENSVNQANKRMRQWSITAVPTLIVNGKYKVSANRSLGTEDILDVVNFLIKKERQLLPNS